MLSKWYCSYDNNLDIDVVYIDLAKAFDIVSHPKLISISKFYAIDDKVMNWIQEFLSNRSQSVCINNALSMPQAVTSGVPQGSVIGPLLFNVYIDDLTNKCLVTINGSDIYLYADDTKLFSSDPSELQTNLNIVECFTISHQLTLAPKKCQHLAITWKRHATSINQYCIGDHVIETTDKVKDLGILISHDLKWSAHVSYIKANAYTCCYRILKSFSTCNIWILLKAFVTYVRPKLEYNTSIWSPHFKKDITSIESVQKHFTRVACNCCTDLLNKLNLKLLEYRRLEFDLILVYKICCKLIDIAFDEFFTYVESCYNLHRRHLSIRSKYLPKHDSFRHFYSNRVVPVWNLLPESIVSLSSLSAFKIRSKKFDLHEICSLVF